MAKIAGSGRRARVAEDQSDDTPNIYRIEDVQLGPANLAKDTAGTDEFLVDAKEIKTLGGLSMGKKRQITNQINKFHRGAGGAESKKMETDAVTGYQALDVVQPTYNLEYLAKLYEKSETHYAAVNAKTSNIVGLGYTLIESPKQKAKLEDLADDKDALARFQKKMARMRDDLYNKIDDFNEDDTFMGTLKKVWTDYEATGNGYIEIGRTLRGDIGYIGHIPSTTMRVRRERDGFVQIISNKAVFFRNFGDTKTPNPIGSDTKPNEVIHLKKYSPASSYYGISDVITAMNAIAGNEFADRFNLDYFENKAVPRHIIILKGAELSSSALRKLTEFFETGFKGRNHRSLFIPLPGDVKDGVKVEFKVEAVESGVQDSSFVNYLKSNLNRILMAHRVPISKVGMAEGVSLAIARDADKTFKEQVCQPEQKDFEKKLNRIVQTFTDAFLIKLDELTLTDADTQSKIWERAVRNGWLLANEIRAEQGRPGIKGGEKSMPQSLLDVESAKLAQQKADAKAQQQQTSARASARSAASPDTSGEARQPKGEGRATA